MRDDQPIPVQSRLAAEPLPSKYFTARIKGNQKKQYRQNTFLSALELHCPKLQIIEGRYLLRDLFCSQCRSISYEMVCPKCGRPNILPEEKKSDVNIATQMLKDAYENKFDVAYLVSGDSDLVPPIEIIHSMPYPKKVIVAFPPHRGGSKELKDVADVPIHISRRIFRESLLPDEIPKPDGTTLKIPPEWNRD